MEMWGGGYLWRWRTGRVHRIHASDSAPRPDERAQRFSRAGLWCPTCWRGDLRPGVTLLAAGSHTTRAPVTTPLGRARLGARASGWADHECANRERVGDRRTSAASPRHVPGGKKLTELA